MAVRWGSMSNVAYTAVSLPQADSQIFELEETEHTRSPLPDKQESAQGSHANLIRAEPEYLRGGRLAIVFRYAYHLR